jgi:hypothetical protein
MKNGFTAVRILIATVLICFTTAYPPAWSNTTRNGRPLAQCLIIDSDGNIDDLRALAMLVPMRHVVAVITTDGMVNAHRGAATIARFLDLMKLPIARQPAVIVGQSRAVQDEAAPTWDWLEPAREDMQRTYDALGTLTGTSIRLIDPKSNSELVQVVKKSVKGCSSVGLLMIGPWSSFTIYNQAIEKPWAFVVSQGRSIEDPMNPEWDRVNCKMDMTSCKAALQIRKESGIIWVDLPGPGSSFPIDDAFFKRLGQTSGAKALTTLMRNLNLSQAQHQWDDMPALYLLYPQAFKRVSDHFQPRLDCSEMKALQITLLNRHQAEQIAEPSAPPNINCK